MIPFSFVKTTTAAFTPAALPNVLGWIDASNSGSVTLNSGHVSQITDQSGHTNTATQGTAANQPLYSSSVQNGLNAMSFDTTDSLVFANALPTSSTMTLAILFKTDATLADNQVFFTIPGMSIYLWHPSDARFLFDMGAITGDPFVYAPAIAASTWYRLVFIWDDTQANPNKARIYLNNVDVTVDLEDGSGNFPTKTIALGDNASHTNSWLGFIGEAVFTSGALGSTDRSNLDTYWKNKWGL